VDVHVIRRARAAVRRRRNWHQLGKFCTVGAVGYGVNLAVYSTLLHHGAHYLGAASASFLVAVTNNFVLNRLWTFRDHRGSITAQGSRFFAVSLGSLVTNLFILWVLVGAGADRFAAQATAIVLVTPFTFLGTRIWAFRAAHRAA
jgi:putative flippase GtrA